MTLMAAYPRLHLTRGFAAECTAGLVGQFYCKGGLPQEPRTGIRDRLHRNPEQVGINPAKSTGQARDRLFVP